MLMRRNSFRFIEEGGFLDSMTTNLFPSRMNIIKNSLKGKKKKKVSTQ
jgi:hypothetical protein